MNYYTLIAIAGHLSYYTVVIENTIYLLNKKIINKKYKPSRTSPTVIENTIPRRPPTLSHPDFLNALKL